MKFFTALFIVVILYINGFDAIQVTLFDRTDNRGASAFLTVHTCTEVPAHLLGRVSSVNTHGGCIVLCDRPRCEGRCEIADHPNRVDAVLTDHYDLSKGNFNDKTTSVKQC